MELEKIPKLTKVSVTSLDKFHHLCNQFSFKHAEMWRFFNLTNKIFTKKYNVQD